MTDKYQQPINELKDILAHPSYKLLVLGASSDEDFLRYSHDPVLKNIWTKTIQEEGLISSDKEAIQQLREDSKKVYMGSTSTQFEVVFGSDPCKIIVLKPRMNTLYGGYVFNKESPLIEIFNYHIQAIQDTEIMTKALNDIDSHIECKDYKEDHFREVDYKDVISAFGVFLLGCVLASGYLLLEIIFQVIHRKRRKLCQNDGSKTFDLHSLTNR